LRATPARPALEAELFGAAGLRLPDLNCLHRAQQIVLSSPPFLAVVSAPCTSSEIRAQAPANSLRRITFKGVELWMAGSAAALSVVRLSDQLALVGTRATLQAIIEQWKSEAGREYSPLLAQAGAFADQKLWVVSGDSPDLLRDAYARMEMEVNRPAAPPPPPEPVVAGALPPAAPAAIPSPRPPERRVIRILGLEGGPREVEVPPER
jgi:hypothetical protein